MGYVSKVFLVVVFVVVVAVGIFLFKYQDFLNKPTFESPELPQAQSLQDAGQEKDIPKVAILARNLEIPWSLVFLPDGSILFTERPGRVRMIGVGGKPASESIYTVGDVKAQGEGGLLGITIDPEFAKNRYVYIYYTYSGGDNTLNRVARFKFDGKSFSDRKVIVDSIPGASNHNGGRIKFGPDGYLYITAGDSQKPSLAQDTNSLAGKILRVDRDGNSAVGNSFGNRVYSYGHRNPQGLAWDSSGQLWETEHGNSRHDEVNKIGMGKNYGWPTIGGQETKAGMEKSVRESGEDTWAPSGLLFYNNSLFWAGLRGSALFEVKDPLGSAKFTVHFKNEYGRLRDVVLGSDGLFYVLTNNRDGRGQVMDGDDKILVINPKKL